VDGFVDTPRLQCRIPTGRRANSEEIAKAVYFLSFAAASYITGTVLSVVAGQLLVRKSARDCFAI
jgi:NAD(P)-dependent dehydrogenase (short-subunit alcohol dehydrogenase family)